MADLVQKLRDEECRREAQFMRSPMMNPPMKFTHDEPMRALLGQAATELEALRKRCEAVEARVAMAMHVLDKIDAGLGGETDDVRDALDPNEAIAAAQEPSHG